MEIRNIIIHEVRKEAHTAAEVRQRDAENEVDEHAERLSSSLAALFKGVNVGGFEEPDTQDDPEPHFLRLLNNYYHNGQFAQFVRFSKAASDWLKEKLDDAQASKGGYLLFNHYGHQDKSFLSVVLLRMKQGMSLSQDLSLTDVDELDLNTLHMAARINLTDWKAGESRRYIAFKIGRQAREVTDYFAKFIGCREYTQAKADTRGLVKATREYCAQHNLSEDDSLVARRAVTEICREHLDRLEPVTLEAISDLLDARFQPQTRDAFLTIAQGAALNLSNTIFLDRRELRSLLRYSGRTTKLYLSFDADLLDGHTIQYNRDQKSLTITELPPSLLEELDRHTIPD